MVIASLAVGLLLSLGQQPPQNAAAAQADLLEKQAVTLVAQRKFPEAIAAADEALAIRERVYGANHPEVAATLHYVGLMHFRSGNPSAAERPFRRALKIWRAAQDATPEELSNALNDLGSTLQQAGQLREAELLLVEALAVLERAKAEPGILAPAFNNVGGLLSERGDYVRAREHFLRARDLWASSTPRDDRYVAIALNNLGLASDRMRRWEEAESYYRSSLALREREGDTTGLAATLNNLAAAVQQQGRLEEPESLYNRALEIYRRLGAGRSAGTGQLLTNMAALFLLRRDLSRAGPLYQEALAIREEAVGSTHPQFAVALQAHAIYLYELGRIDDAIAAQARATEILEGHVASLIEIGSESQKENYLATFRDSIDITLWLRTQGGGDRASDTALLTVLRRKGRIQDVLASSSRHLRADISAQAREDLDELARARAALARLVFQDNVPPRTMIDAFQRRIDDLEARVNAHAGRVAPPQDVSIGAIQAAIPVDAVLIEFFKYRAFNPRATKVDERFQSARYVACALRRDGAPRWIELGDAVALDAAVDSFRLALLNPARRDVVDRAKSMGPLLSEPLARLTEDANTVLVAPDGDLNLLPFQALIGRDGHYLVERQLFVYLSSGRDLLRPPGAAPQTGPAVVFANPSFGVPSAAGGPVTRSFASLRGAETEGRAVAGLLPGATLLNGPRATEGAIKALRSPFVLHIATHGFFLSADPQDALAGTRGLRRVSNERPYVPPLLRSGLAMAGANVQHRADEDDGILTAGEAASLDLHGTSLVFLSACESGLGVVNAGESVYGLRRAFTIAGTRAQVLTLWQVSDAATQSFVVDFYRRLRAGSTGATALRDAQRAALTNRSTSHPFYWAAFIYSGAVRD